MGNKRIMYAIVPVPVERTDDLERDRGVARRTCEAMGIHAATTVLELEELPAWVEAEDLLGRMRERNARMVEQFDRRRSMLGEVGAAGVRRLASLIGPKPQTLEELGSRTIEGLAGAGMLLVAGELANLGVFQESLRKFAGDGRQAETVPAPDAPTKPPPRRARAKKTPTRRNRRD